MIEFQSLFFDREFLGQAWIKSSKKSQAEHITQMTKRFNDGSRLISSDIISRCVQIVFVLFFNEICANFFLYLQE